MRYEGEVNCCRFEMFWLILSFLRLGVRFVCEGEIVDGWVMLGVVFVVGDGFVY